MNVMQPFHTVHHAFCCTSFIKRWSLRKETKQDSNTARQKDSKTATKQLQALRTLEFLKTVDIARRTQSADI